jgi:glycosyltransferase involved in cell wall biosynthesis
LEVSRFSANRTARAGVNVRHIYGSLWQNEIEPITLAQVKQRDPHSWIMCGRIWIVKKFEIGIRAVPDTDSLKIVGDPSVHPEYYQRLRRLAHGKNVIFCGRKSDQERNELMSGARGLLVCSSQVVGGKFIEQAELFGIVVAEAVAKGILPIVSGIPPFREVMEIMKLGRYVFEPDNPADARKKLRLVQDLCDEEYLAAVKIAQEAIRRNMVWDDIVERVGL